MLNYIAAEPLVVAPASCLRDWISMVHITGCYGCYKLMAPTVLYLS